MARQLGRRPDALDVVHVRRHRVRHAQRLPHELLLDEQAFAPDGHEELAVPVAGLERHLDLHRSSKHQRAEPRRGVRAPRA
jgi:hypothetical protein